VSSHRPTTLLAIVPARAGSKGVPGKNKALIAGIPMIDYTIAAVKGSRAVTGIVVTSDDPYILGLYIDDKAILTVKRPSAIARDDSRTADAVAHSLEKWAAAGKELPDAILLAQPTTPLRTASDIDRAFELFEHHGREPVISACRAEGIRHPRVMYRLSDDGHGILFDTESGDYEPRQNHEVVFQRNGAIYIASTAFFFRTGKLRNATPIIYEMPWERSINIDQFGDMVIAKALIESGLVDTAFRRR
jgi:CMP-N,N'-diacetyllegionaminic acid synthase